MTSQQWLLRLVFRVARNAFTSSNLQSRLGIRPLDASTHLGLPVYSQEERVWVTNHKGPWQSVTVQVHRLDEIDTPAFRDFVSEAARSFHKALLRLKTKPEDVMPWKLQGERWHLGEKGFPIGKKLRWDRAALPALLALVRSIEPKVEIGWDNRDAITLKVPGVSRSWAQWRTKQADALDCRFLGKRGQFNLSQVEGLGAQAVLSHHRSDGDLLKLQFVQWDPTKSAALKKVLTEHLAGFREMAGG